MKRYNGKTLQDAINAACQDLGITTEELEYEIISETKGLFSKNVEIECFTETMIEQYIENYVRVIVSNIGLDVETVTYKQDDRIYCNVNSSNNSILIGKNGVILRAINLLTRNAVSHTFKKRIEVSVDINGYREERYKKVAAMARRFGKQVQRTKAEMKLDPLPSDERKVMHQELTKFDHIKTESHGEGKNRYLTISYVD